MKEIVNCVAAYRDGMGKTEVLLSKEKSFVLYAVMNFIINRYFPTVEELETDLQDIEEKVFKEKQPGKYTS